MSRRYQLLCFLYFVTAFASQNRADYVIGGGYRGGAEFSCESEGFEYIMDPTECLDAIRILGGTDSDNQVTGPGWWDWVPKGCTMQNGDATPESGLIGARNAHFSPTSGNNNHGGGGYILICKRRSIEGVIIQTDCDGNPQNNYVLDSLCRTRSNNVERSASCFIGSNEFELKAFDCSDVNPSSQTLQLDHCYSEEGETKYQCVDIATATDLGYTEYWDGTSLIEDTIVWSNMKGFDSVCSTSDEYSIDIRIDQTLYAQLDEDYVGEDCNTLCESVGSVCLDGWADVQNSRCPVGDETTNNIGCSDRNQNTFVCSCAVFTSPGGFALIDGAPRSGQDPPEIFNPDPYQDLGEVQCCHPVKQCTRRDPWNSRDNNDCMSGRDDNVKYSLHEAISMCEALGDDWTLCTREEVNSRICKSKGCGHDSHLVWAWDPNAISASKVINYDDCTTEISVTGPHRPENGWNHGWNTQCPENNAIVSVETREVEKVNSHFWTIMQMQCCGLIDKITDSENYHRLPEQGRLQGGGSSAVEDQWEAQCGPNAIMVGIWDDDDSGDFDDIDAAKCSTLDCPYTCGEKIDDDCVVINLSPNSKSSCPVDYVLVGLYDDETTRFDRVRKMKCCRVLESILPTVSPTQMPTTDDPSECPTVSPTTSIPSMSPTTDDPTLYPSQNPTTDKPTRVPSLTPSTEEPTYYPTTSPSKNPTTETPTVSPTDQPTAFPSTAPTHAPTICEPTCRSHTDQLVKILERLLDFNLELWEEERPTSNSPLKNKLDEMILDFIRLKGQMQIHDSIPIFPPIV